MSEPPTLSGQQTTAHCWVNTSLTLCHLWCASTKVAPDILCASLLLQQIKGFSSVGRRLNPHCVASNIRDNYFNLNYASLLSFAGISQYVSVFLILFFFFSFLGNFSASLILSFWLMWRLTSPYRSTLGSRLKLIVSQLHQQRRYLVWHARKRGQTGLHTHRFHQIHLRYQRTWEVHVV